LRFNGKFIKEKKLGQGGMRSDAGARWSAGETRPKVKSGGVEKINKGRWMLSGV